MEGAWAIKNKLEWKNLVSFSEQQLMDCSKSYGNLGCKGGFEDAALTYAIDKGIEKDYDYQYHEFDSKCHYNPDKVVGKPKNCTYIPAGKLD